LGAELKRTRGRASAPRPLAGKSVALLFDKPSLRTKFSFSIGVHELGGFPVESHSSQRKSEEPEDLAQVLSGYVHAIVLRTFSHDVLERMASVSTVPIVNGLSDDHHPCQILADLLSLKERFGKLEGLKLAYIGDGNNILHSLLLLAPLLGVHLAYACPEGYSPKRDILAAALAAEASGSIRACASPELAVREADGVYTDVWTSMGFEQETAARLQAFQGYQVNEELLVNSRDDAVVMHCLPMERGHEISAGIVDSSRSIIFSQSENRLHMQKALLAMMVGNI
jgi:ornithine carbamoyltransferase